MVAEHLKESLIDAVAEHLNSSVYTSSEKSGLRHFPAVPIKECSGIDEFVECLYSQHDCSDCVLSFFSKQNGHVLSRKVCFSDGFTTN